MLISFKIQAICIVHKQHVHVLPLQLIKKENLKPNILQHYLLRDTQHSNSCSLEKTPHPSGKGTS